VASALAPGGTWQLPWRCAGGCTVAPTPSPAAWPGFNRAGPMHGQALCLCSPCKNSLARLSPSPTPNDPLPEQRVQAASACVCMRVCHARTRTPRTPWAAAGTEQLSGKPPCPQGTGCGWVSPLTQRCCGCRPP